MNLTEFETKLKEHKIRLLKGKQLQTLYQIIVTYNCRSTEMQQAIEEYVAPVYRDRLTKIAQPLFDNLKEIIRQCMAIMFMRPKDVMTLIESILGGQQEKIKQLIKEYGFHDYFSQEFNAAVVKIGDISAKFRYQSLELQFTVLIKRLINELEEPTIQKQKNQINSLEQFKGALKTERIFVKAQCLNELYHTIQYLGHKSESSYQMIKNSTYPAFEKELRQLSQCIGLKYTSVVRNIVPKLTDQFYMDSKDAISLFQNYEDKEKYQKIITNYGIQDEDIFLQIEESLGLLIDNIPSFLNKKLVISNITEFIKQEYFGNEVQKQQELIKEQELPSIKEPVINAKIDPSIFIKQIQSKVNYQRQYLFINQQQSNLHVANKYTGPSILRQTPKQSQNDQLAYSNVRLSKKQLLSKLNSTELSTRNSSQKSIKDQFYYTKIQIGISLLKKHYHQMYPTIQLKIINKLATNQIYSKQLQAFITSFKQSKIATDDFKAIAEAVDKVRMGLDNFKRKISKMMDIFKFYDKLFANQVTQLQFYLGRVDSLKLSDAYQIDQQYQQIYDKSEEIHSAQQSIFWRKQKINNLESIISEYQNVMKQNQPKNID